MVFVGTFSLLQTQNRVLVQQSHDPAAFNPFSFVLPPWEEPL